MKKNFILLMVAILVQTACFANDYFGYGVAIKKQDNNLIIENVIKNTKAEQSGVKTGQKIISINGKKIEKLKDEDIKNIDQSKQLKLVTDKNTKINLKPENITLVNSYNEVKDTYNNSTAYKVNDYITNRVIMPELLDDNKYVNYTNAFFNYADIVLTTNNKEYVELFNITQKNVDEAIEKAKKESNSQYYDLYKEFLTNAKSDTTLDNAFKNYLELAIYTEQNQELINRQISEFNNSQKKQFAKYVYNTRVVANLYYDACSQLNLFTYKSKYDMNKISKWKHELSSANDFFNVEYKKLKKVTSKNKIDFKKPSMIATLAQTTNTPPAITYITYKEINDTARAAGYNPDNSIGRKQIIAERIKEQKAKEAAEKNFAEKNKNSLKATSKIATINQNTDNITFFGGFNYNSNIVDILNYFNKIPTVKSIKIDGYEYKGKTITENTLFEVFARHDAEEEQKRLKGKSYYFIKDSARFYKFYDGSKYKFVTYPSIKIQDVHIAGIPFVLYIVVWSQPEYHFYHKNEKLKYYKGCAIPHYTISEMRLINERHDIWYYGERVDNLINLYKDKYKKYLKTEGSYILYNNMYYANQPKRYNLYFDDNMSIYIDRSGPLIIEYRDLDYDYYSEKYKKDEKEHIFKQNLQYSQDNKI